MNNSAVLSAFYFAVLQVLWIFRLMYDTVVSGNDNNEVKPINKFPKILDVDDKKRHLIRLVTTPSTVDGRPTYYMRVCEIMSPVEEEMLRRACAKGVPASDSSSRRSFADVWMDSFSTLAA